MIAFERYNVKCNMTTILVCQDLIKIDAGEVTSLICGFSCIIRPSKSSTVLRSSCISSCCNAMCVDQSISADLTSASLQLECQANEIATTNFQMMLGDEELNGIVICAKTQSIQWQTIIRSTATVILCILCKNKKSITNKTPRAFCQMHKQLHQPLHILPGRSLSCYTP